MSAAQPSSTDAAGWQREAQQWHDKHDKLFRQFNEFVAESKELERELDMQLEQSQQSNKRLENDLSMLKRQFADLRLQKTTGDAEHSRTLTQLRASLDEAQQKLQQQTVYIARLETETDELSTHKRVLEQSVRDYAEKVETLEEQRAMYETQLHFQKTAHDETVQRLRDRVRELEEDMQAAHATAVSNNSNTLSTTTDAMQIVSDDKDESGSHVNNYCSTPLRPTRGTTEPSSQSTNKRIKSSSSTAAVAANNSPAPFAATKASSRMRSPAQPLLVDNVSFNLATAAADPIADKVFFSTNEVPPRTALSSLPGDIAAMPATDGSSMNDDAHDNNNVDQHMKSAGVSDDDADDDEEEHDHGYSSTPTSDKQQNNKSSSAQHDTTFSIDCAENIGVASSSAAAPKRSCLPNSKTLIALSSNAVPPAATQMKNVAATTSSRKSMVEMQHARSLRAGSVDESSQQQQPLNGRKSFCPPNAAHQQRLMSLPNGGGGGSAALSYSTNNSKHATLAEQQPMVDFSSSARSHQFEKTAVPPSAGASRLLPPQSGPAGNVHVSWFRSMQLVDKALLKLNALEKNVSSSSSLSRQPALNGAAASSICHFTSTTEKKKISSSSSPFTSKTSAIGDSHHHHHHMQNHMPLRAAGGAESDAAKKQRSITDGAVPSSGQFTIAPLSGGAGDACKLDKTGLLVAVNNNNDASMRDAKRNGGVPIDNKNGSRTSKILAPIMAMQPPPRAASSSSQSSTLSSMSSGNSAESGLSTTSSIPAPSKMPNSSNIVAPIRNFSHNPQQLNNIDRSLRLRAASALPTLSVAPLTVAPPSFMPKPTTIRQPTSNTTAVQPPSQMMRQPFYQPPNVVGSSHATTLSGAGGKQRLPTTTAIPMKQ